MLRVRELAATRMERSSVKAGMTEEREWDIETGNGDKERDESQEVSGRSSPLKCSNVRSVRR